MATELRSRLAPDQPAAYQELFRVAAQQAQQAEVILLRKLLFRVYGVLQDVELVVQFLCDITVILCNFLSLFVQTNQPKNIVSN